MIYIDKIYYLDNAATTQIDDAVLKDMMPYLTTEFFNPGSSYQKGIDVANAISLARESVSNLINAEKDQIIFTSGGTEANNLVFWGTTEYLKSIGKTHLIVSAIEHDSVLNSAKQVCIKHGFDVSCAPVKEDGCVDVDYLEKMITDDTGLVSVMHINNETGSVNDVERIGKLCNDKNILFHTDCVQSLGYEDVDVKRFNCDFLSMSAHKINGPKGTGALFVKDKSILSPVICGGLGQEYGLRGGTENVAGIVGFGSACKLANNLTEEKTNVSKYVVPLYNNMILNRIRKNLNEKGYESRVHLNGMDESVSRKTMSLRFDDIDGETLVLALAANGVMISSGSACRSNRSEPSHVLKAMGLSDEEARSTVRITPESRSTSINVIDVLAASDIISDTVINLYSMIE